ncbi:MAG: LD-carboxypeptidase [Deltaproteobacteria bacterium]|nr:LD-carboxypeptidase [Deltaproteobacteria bacterium]
MRFLHKPPRLGKGDLIGIAAPSGACEISALQPVLSHLEKAGLRFTYRDDLSARHRYMAGTDQRRADELMALLTNPEVRAIFCARGGYGAQRIIPRLDAARIPDEPKILVGYSDITVLQGWLARHKQWATFYGPTVRRHLAPDAPPESLAWLRQLLASPESPGVVPAQTLRVIRPGIAEGPLIGGCLTLLSMTIGTAAEWPVQPGDILFVEDIAEPVYAIDRLLTHLQQRGLFDAVAGVLFGTLTPPANDPARDELLPMLTDFFADFPGPVLTGLPVGHADPFYTLPLGRTLHVRTDSPTVTLVEGAVL